MKSPLQQLLLSRSAEPVIFAAEYSQLGHISSPRKKKKRCLTNCLSNLLAATGGVAQLIKVDASGSKQSSLL